MLVKSREKYSVNNHCLFSFQKVSHKCKREMCQGSKHSASYCLGLHTHIVYALKFFGALLIIMADFVIWLFLSWLSIIVSQSSPALHSAHDIAIISTISFRIICPSLFCALSFPHRTDWLQLPLLQECHPGGVWCPNKSSTKSQAPHSEEVEQTDCEQWNAWQSPMRISGITSDN